MSAGITQIAAAAAELQAIAQATLNAPLEGQGGIYAGLRITPDGKNLYALILATEEPENKLSWKQGQAWAMQLEVDGHRDFTMPDRFEALQLRETVRSRLAAYGWMWTDTQCSAGLAFHQDFDGGGQISYGDKKALGSVRAVRRLPIDPSILFSGGAQ